ILEGLDGAEVLVDPDRPKNGLPRIAALAYSHFVLGDLRQGEEAGRRNFILISATVNPHLPHTRERGDVADSTMPQAENVGGLAGARIVLGVSGGIAAYKAADLCSKLVQVGASVDVVLTQGALRFLQPLVFNAITRRPVHTASSGDWTPESAGHVTLAHDADALAVVPATAHTIARLALGLADDLLGTIAHSTRTPLLLAPAMEHNMWHHPAIQGHLETLRSRGALVVGPGAGRLASGMIGDGRLAPIEDLVGAVRLALGRSGPLAGRRVVVTAGPTHEPLDPVRYLGNRSSGRMGFALAQQLLDRGASVDLVAGPTALPRPYGANVTPVETAEEMLDATAAAVEHADALIMTAAVADFRPSVQSPQKIKKQAGQEPFILSLVRNPDILASIEKPGLIKIGFAAETEDIIANAEAKLRAKRTAMIVANDAESTIGNHRSTATILRPDSPPEVLPDLSKEALAFRLADELVNLLEDRSGERRP
ncbi:MAG TPA: bifunctional phosphopantothenoylcysteine decarboxylase/phosphopantothenate--cysteine ligase CoaBC, partial [Thermomicrobiales bacterium]|nr:bifunctional phosphopantothenoylcysteine decarboxylase/phosphopantothenate--cysteine ligase CoaBC [Thermomicrobiales bacterium]